MVTATGVEFFCFSCYVLSMTITPTVERPDETMNNSKKELAIPPHLLWSFDKNKVTVLNELVEIAGKLLRPGGCHRDILRSTHLLS